MIFVTGVPRSGTSLTTQILHAHGCNLGEVNSLYENVKIREGILKPYLRGLGADPLGQRDLPDINRLPPIPDLRGRMGDCLPGERPFAYKDAKLTLVWPVFHAEFPRAIWIIVRRDPADIADSCMRTSFMRAYNTKEKWRTWIEEYECRIGLLKQKVTHWVEVWPERFIDNPIEFKTAAQYCGIDFDLSVASKCIEKRLWKSVVPNAKKVSHRNLGTESVAPESN
jgi:hypothetical protein